MHFDTQEIISIIKKNYRLDVSVKQLPGELDLNYYLETPDGKAFIFKIANQNELKVNLELQNACIRHLLSKNLGLTVSSIVTSLAGEEILELKTDTGNIRLARLLTWVEGRVLASVNPHSTNLLERLGEMCGTLCLSLVDFDHSAAHRFMKWNPSEALWIKPHLINFKGERKGLVDYFSALFETTALPLLPHLRKSINYNDANDYNVLVSHDVENPTVPGVIDFGDLVYTHTVNELAIAIAYAIMGKTDPLEAACHIVTGFNNKFQLTEQELKSLFPLTIARLLISITCSELNRLEHPENSYLQISDEAAWNLLKKLRSIDPALAEASFRNACNRASSINESRFTEWAKENYSKVSTPVLFKSYDWLDLSVGSLDLGNSQDIYDNEKLNERLSALVSQSSSEVSLGKYNEARAIYSTGAFEERSNEGPRWRTIHLGLDFFCERGTSVYAIWEGVIHSLSNNSADRDYGPTLIIEHQVAKDLTFYTLYGHLSEVSLQNKFVGKKIEKGEVIATIGSLSENGGWTPHLHFQVMLDMLGKKGDFPGVCNYEQVTLWRGICPDPWLLLTGKLSPSAKTLTKEDIVSYRRKHLGKNLSVSYKDPIKMVRGAGQYLVDDTGRKYLDTVNNVAHVGHEHSRVVRAGQRQMAVLNTNTRYLHENLVKFVEELLQTMPAHLNVAFVVNSGSEANELALRLAKNYTNQKDIIVSEVGYHGNTNACVEISSYKFDGVGGKGKAPHIHVVPIPDTYRGIYRGNDLLVGKKYADHVSKAIESMQTQSRKPAAFIFESVISCGGQVELPLGFLKQSYEFVRKAGGVCIADEVQTGCGRAGDHFWAFEQHDVVPDIVTIGKPIGNGHPLGVVVTTQEVADAFKNGMEYFNTFGGNPVSCAIGLEVLRVIKEEGLQQNAKVVGDYLKNGLKSLMNDFEIIGDVRGPGLFIGIELVEDRDTKEPATRQAFYFANRMRDKGILMSTDGPFNNVLKIKPPIIFSKQDSDFLLESMTHVLAEDFVKSV